MYAENSIQTDTPSAAMKLHITVNIWHINKFGVLKIYKNIKTLKKRIMNNIFNT